MTLGVRVKVFVGKGVRVGNGVRVGGLVGVSLLLKVLVLRGVFVAGMDANVARGVFVAGACAALSTGVARATPIRIESRTARRETRNVSRIKPQKIILGSEGLD